ncbi:hypothetical protein [Sandaracinus amylolyticus]|uniref:hypothetical protein n=1 Tax=Sandaracinus amylolyticus TaxID=927083 RepID=UPI001F434F96|nr:hypothetical protein [Sandaracinus amylolyticus]
MTPTSAAVNTQRRNEPIRHSRTTRIVGPGPEIQDRRSRSSGRGVKSRIDDHDRLSLDLKSRIDDSNRRVAPWNRCPVIAIVRVRAERAS